jgi:crotonobetainyl-CoA:carnitine CoA-transferase CaiB-like acyl-CoA transferase
MKLPLEGLRVVDLTTVMSGPFCAMTLGDMGADVIKIETVPDGDTIRRFDPLIHGESYCFAVINRNKRSLALNLKDPRGKDLFMTLAAGADIVLENFRPGVTRRLGIDYESLSARNPGLVYASISGFGQTGPLSGKGGYDIIAQGMSGIMMMTGLQGSRPVKVGIAMNDIAAGITTTYAVLGALIGKLRHGKGQYVETSLLEAGLAWTHWEFAAFFGAGERPTATGTRHRRAAPYQALRTQDGYVTVGANTEKLWRALCVEVCAQPQWLEDARFRTNSLRVANVDALEAVIETVLTTRPTVYWVERLDAAGIPGGPVYTYEQALSDPHILDRRMVVDIDHPVIGPMKNIGLPVKSSGSLAAIRRPAPLLGEHSAEVLGEIGVDEARFADLVKDGVVIDGRRR